MPTSVPRRMHSGSRLMPCQGVSPGDSNRGLFVRCEAHRRRGAAGCSSSRNHLGLGVTVSGSNLNFAAHVGLLSASVTNYFFALGQRRRSRGGRTVRPGPFACSATRSCCYILTLSKSGSLSIDLPIAATLTPSIPARSRPIFALTNSAIFATGQPTVTSSGFAGLAPFATLTGSDIVDMFSKIESWMSGLQAAKLFAAAVPFVSNLKLADGLDFATGFASQIIAKIADATGEAKFSSVQSLLSLLGVASTVQYSPGNSTLTFPVTFTKARRSRPASGTWDFR